MHKFILWVDNCIVETTTTKEKAQYYADAWYETLPNIEIKIEKV